jgi:hypothetical protein
VVGGCCALAAEKNCRLNARAAPARSGARRRDLGGKTTLIFSQQIRRLKGLESSITTQDSALRGNSFPVVVRIVDYVPGLVTNSNHRWECRL